MEEKKQKPKVPISRGYYSELITDDSFYEKFKEELPGARKKTKLLWQIGTEKNAPIIRQMNASVKGAFLAPAERWMTFDADKHIVSLPIRLKGMINLSTSRAG